MALYYPLSASLVLFTNILLNPRDTLAASDIHLMNLITSFITQSVQPGTSFAATPTLTLVKELYSIATRLVARVAPQPKSYEPAQSDFISPSEVRPVPDQSFSSNMNTHITTTFVSS